MCVNMKNKTDLIIYIILYYIDLRWRDLKSSTLMNLNLIQFTDAGTVVVLDLDILLIKFRFETRPKRDYQLSFALHCFVVVNNMTPLKMGPVILSDQSFESKKRGKSASKKC